MVRMIRRSAPISVELCSSSLSRSSRSLRQQDVVAGLAVVIVVLKPGGSLSGGTEDDIIAFTAPSGSTTTFSGATIRGDGGNDRVYGSVKPDTIYGDAGDDLIDTYGDAATYATAAWNAITPLP